MKESITQAQDHDRRIGRLEGIAEQLDRRLDSIERRIDNLERTVAAGFAELRQDIAALNQRLDSQTRWLVGIQLASLIALGTLILSRLPG